MNIIEYLTTSQLIRAINTSKNYIVLDTRYSCNHSAGKVTFTNLLDRYVDRDGNYLDYVLMYDLCDMTAIHCILSERIKRINGQWLKYCYDYVSFDAFCKECHGISERQYRKALKWCDL